MLRNDPGPRRRALPLFGWVAAGLIAASVPEVAAASQGRGGESVASVLRTADADRDLAAFYAARGHRPLWVRGGAPQSEAFQLLSLIEGAVHDGLDPERYGARRLAALLEEARGGDPRALAAAELALSRALADYAADLTRTEDTGMVYVDRELAPRAVTPAAALRAAASARSLRTHLDALPRLNPVYARLRTGYADWRSAWGGLPTARIAGTQTLRTGASGDRVRQLRRRLGLPAGTRYDAAVAERVRAFQAAHGLTQSGIADARTIAALNRGPAHYDRLIRANLERARALPADMGRRYVLVDAAAARLWLYEDGRAVDSMKAVVGKASEPTPMMAAYMRYLVLNPYWNVPPDLVQARIAPAVLSEGLGFLARRGYQVVSDWDDDAEPVDPTRVDWRAVAAGRKELPVRQLPGRDNMMGEMKFMMPNEMGIYLHDTPDRSLFANDDRRASAGCVRVEDARRLARWLYGRVPTVAADRHEHRVNLSRPVPVYITYLTAAPSDTGGIAFRDDIYDRDGPLLARLARTPVRLAYDD
jgi:L,D-transpeptidase YcbB